MEFRLLGPIEVEESGRLLSLGGPKQRAVLAMLALECGRVVSRDRLIEGVWSDQASVTAVATLQVYIAMLRKALESANGDRRVIVARAPGYVLEVDAEDVDAMRFDRLVTQGRKALIDERYEAASKELQSALTLWRGEPMADLDADRFAAADITRLTELKIGALEDRIEAELACGRHAGVVAELETLVTEHPLRERLWGHLMLALYRAGQQADALSAFGRAKATLLEEFGIDPSPALRDLEMGILNQDPGLAAPPGTARAKVKLPAPAHELIGRDDDIAVVCGAIAAGSRCVTVTGPGGMGKTSLALEVAARMVDAFAGGVYFVPLESVLDADLVLPTVAEVLQVRAAPGEPLDEAIAVSLGSRPTLLVLDNLEQLRPAARAIADLINRTPDLTVLATSRAALRLGMETEHSLAALDLSGPAASSPAVQLFVARSRDVRSDFALTAADASIVTEICRKVDGLPLAIELAAARSSLMEPATLLQRLDQQLRLLTSGRVDLPDRQRTMRATLSWSFELLSPHQQRLLVRLGAVAAEMTLDTAEALMGDEEIVDGLGALVDNGLVRRVERQGGARLRLLGTVREYAAERLTASGEEHEVRATLAKRLLDALEEEVAQLTGPGAPAALLRLDGDYPDIRASMAWALEHEIPSVSARFAIALRPYWLTRGSIAEGREWLGKVLDRLPVGDPLRAAAEFSAGILAYLHDDGGEANRLLVAAAHGAQQHGDLAVSAGATIYLGALVLRGGDDVKALQMAESALDLAEAHDLYEPMTLALSLSAIVAATRGDLDRERDVYRKRLELTRRRGDRRKIAETLNNLAEVSLAEGGVSEARTYADEALELARNVDRLVTRDVLITRGRVGVVENDLTLAHERLAEALQLSVELGQQFEIAQCLLALAGAAGRLGDNERAARLYGAAKRLRGDAAPLEVELEPEFVEQREAIRAELGEAAFEGSRAHGAAMHRDAAVAYALERDQSR